MNGADYARPDIAAMVDIDTRTESYGQQRLANSHWSLKQKGFIDWVEPLDSNGSPFFFVTLTDRGIRYMDSTKVGPVDDWEMFDGPYSNFESGED